MFIFPCRYLFRSRQHFRFHLQEQELVLVLGRELEREHSHFRSRSRQRCHFRFLEELELGQVLVQEHFHHFQALSWCWTLGHCQS
jgi:hypothetical protein